MITATLDNGNIECHEQPVGTHCFYRHSDHCYAAECKPNGSKFTMSGRITGCSTPVKVLDTNNDPLLDWAARLSCEGGAELIEQIVESTPADALPEALAWFTPDRIWDELKEQQLTWRHRREKRGEEGQQAHDVLHALATGQQVDYEALDGYGRAVSEFWLEQEIDEVLQAEEVVYSPTHNFAGRFDLRAVIGGQVWLLDLKTSKHIGAPFHAQLAGYDLAAIESGYGPSDRLVVLKVNADGLYELIDAEAGHDDFLVSLAAYEAAKRINNAARRAKKAREAVAA